MASGLIVREQDKGGFVEVEIAGEVDIFTCQELKNQLYQYVDQYGKDLVLDCKSLNYIDSTGLGVFVAALKKVKQIHKDITIRNLKESILKLFLITQLDKLFNIENDGSK